MIKYFLFILLLLLCQCQQNKTLFTQLPAEETGITFSNRIAENDTLNILTFEYVYNGGGVGIGDFNGDGKPDVYFTGNTVANKLYLNEGNFKFRDVTQTAKATGEGRWCSGVSVVDINHDNLPDLYVSATARKAAADRRNLLYVNQGNDANDIPVFREMAVEYGIADTSHTTHAAFFDYDNDGDLDLYVLVDEIEKFPNKYHHKITDGSAPTTDRLYRNDWNDSLQHAFFTNVSREAGINIEGYGLGLNICDINRDGWKDIYITNDYLTNDLLYINNQNGTFTNRADSVFKHTGYSAMGNDVTDLNNDGLADIVALDMMPEDNYRKKTMVPDNSYTAYINNGEYGYQYQYGRNTLQLNQGTLPGKKMPVFSETGLLAGVGQTDWSWCPLAVDFDHDGFRDLIITNGFPKDVTDRDFVVFRSVAQNLASREMKMQQIPSVKIKNYAYRNTGNATFENVTEAWGIDQPSFSNGAAYADLDNDGDLDYVVNNINDSAFVYRNNLVEQKKPESNYLRIKFRGEKLNLEGLGTMVELHYDNGKTQLYEHSPYRGYLSSVEPTAHFGLGKVQNVDSVKIIWQNGKVQLLRNVKANQVLEVDVKNAALEKAAPQKSAEVLFADESESFRFLHTESDYIDFNVQKLLPHKFSQYGPGLAVADVNGDGLDDFYAAGAAHRKGVFFVQNTEGQFDEKDLLPGKPEDKIEEEAGILFFDADNDGDADLYLASGSNEQPAGSFCYQDRLFLNEKGKFILAEKALPENRFSKSCVKAADFDKDGDLDLFIGERLVPEKYPLPVSGNILRNDSKGGKVQFADVTQQIAPTLQNIGLISDALWTDYDNDGWTDLLIAGEWMPLTFLKNHQGNLLPDTRSPELKNQTGWWNSLIANDFDKDGDMDYIAGNWGLNTLMQASEQEPVRIYAGDFNKDGNLDALPSVYFKDPEGRKQEFPFFGRDDMIKQMIGYRKFADYKSFALGRMENMFQPGQQDSARKWQAAYLKTSYLENLGNGRFELKALPLQAQLAPVFGMTTSDFDGDGNPDVLLVGNDFGCEVGQGRMDALNGLLLRGDGRGNFQPVRLPESNFYVPGDAKALIQLNQVQGKRLILASQNRGKLRVFSRNILSKVIRLQPGDVFAVITGAGGRQRKEEFYWGNSFYSQSARMMILKGDEKAIHITDFQGRTRKVMRQGL
jgi:enediyne biosynthesis protein E4